MCKRMTRKRGRRKKAAKKEVRRKIKGNGEGK